MKNTKTRQKKEVRFSDFYNSNLCTWCTNCGNYGIWAATKRALVAENISPQHTLMCFDIGCNGNGSDKIKSYRFHGLHGRVIPFAAGAHLANRAMTVIASGGDGGTLSEGIGHLVHAVRSNYDMVFLLHNNSNYGLTTGQASATTRRDVPMNVSPDGVITDPINVMDFVLGLGATFAARGFSGNVGQLTGIIQEAIKHKGFAFVEVLQSCPTYNKETTHEWYIQRVYDLSEQEKYDKSDIAQAREVSQDLDKKIATGVIYQDPGSVDYYSRLKSREGIKTDVVEEVAGFDIRGLLSNFL